MTRVLVTGGQGLIGRYAVRRLIQNGVEVHVAGRRPDRQLTGSGLHAHHLNIMDRNGVEVLLAKVQPTHLLHLAWETAHGKYWLAPENLDWVAATLHLVRTFVSVGGCRFVGAGTCAEYDWTSPDLEQGPCHETLTPTSPNLLYGVAKDATRRIVESFAKTNEFEMSWGRVFLLFDANEDPRRFVKSIVTSILAGQRASCTAGTQVRDFLSAADVGAAFADLTLSSVCGPVNIGSGQGRSLADIATMIGSQMGHPELIGLGDYPTRPGDPPYLVADAGRLQNEVGFQPDKSIEERIAECIAAITGND